jgi:signal transduction histidine kinase
MSIFKYLKEHLRLIAFYVLLMVFVISVISFDRSNRLLQSDILYIAGVSFAMLFIYLLTDYIIQYRHIKSLLLEGRSKGSVPVLPKPQDSRDEAYAAIIEKLYADCTQRVGNLKEEFKENMDFMTAWAHEIKTPITTSKLLLQGDIDSDAIESMKEEIEKIENDVEKVLYNARSGEFTNDYLISEENLSKLVKESVKKHSTLFIRKHIEFSDRVPDHFTVDSDKKWLAFIIDQLFSNALKYTPEHGCISVRAERNDKETVLRVKDNGSGIKSEDLKRLFAKSFTGQNGRAENSKATGMGLYLSQKLAKQLGASITIDSEFGRGTEASIHFPALSDYYNITKM